MSAPTITDLPSIPSPGDSDFETAAVTLLTAFKNVFVGEVNDFGEYLDGGAWLTDAILPVSKGGTGASSFTSGYVPYYNGSAFVDSSIIHDSNGITLQETNPGDKRIGVVEVTSGNVYGVDFKQVGNSVGCLRSYNGGWKEVLKWASNYNVWIPSGNLGIGGAPTNTTQTLRTLEVVGNSYTSVLCRNTSSDEIAITANPLGNNLFSSNTFKLLVNSPTTVALFADSSGNLGIGTTSPSEKLDVAGNVRSSGRVYPSVSGTYSLGQASNLWSEVFAANGTINTSDAREKTDVRQFTADELNAAKLLANEIGFFKFLSSIALKGDAARTHVGMTVQRAIEIMQSCNLDPFAYGFICYDEWDRKVVEHPEIPARPEIPAQEFIPAVIDPETGNIISAEVPAVEYSPAVEAVPAWTEVLTEAGNRYGFRYDQLTLFMAKGFYQMSVDAVSNLQAQINALKSV